MRSVRVLFARLRALVSRSRLERELADELESHLQMHVDDNVRAGMSPDEALRVARMRLGVESTKEAYRERRDLPLLETSARDLHHGFRMLLRNPLFATVAVLTFAVGIGATTAIFSVVYATLLAPLPFPDADQLVMVWSNKQANREIVAPRDYLEWKRRATSFSALEAFAGHDYVLVGSGEPEQISGDRMTAGMLDMLGERPQLGRYFDASDAAPGAEKVVIITNRLWQRRFGADPAIIGQRIRLDGELFTVVGVRPPGVPDRVASQLTTVLALRPDADDADNHWILVMGRLRSDVPLGGAQAEMDAISAALASENAKDADWTTSVEALKNDFLPSETRTRLWLLMAAVGLVLMIACANIANLLLARGSARQRELSVRASIGASPSRLFRQLLTESLALASVGAVLGVALSWVVLRSILAIMPPYMLPSEADVSLNIPVLLVTLGVAVLAGILFGCAPALQAARTDLNGTLKDGARAGADRGRQRLRRVLVVAEFALALSLLACAALVLHSVWNLSRADLGIRTTRVLTFSLPGQRARLSSPERVNAFYDRLVESVGAIPGVEQVGLSAGRLLEGERIGLDVAVAGRTGDASGATQSADFMSVSPGFFDAYGVAVTRGRSFTDSDADGGERVAMVNESFARRSFPGSDPVGETLLVPEVVSGGDGPGRPVPCRIVGVFRTVRQGGPRGKDFPEVYLPFRQSPWPSAAVAIRTTGDPAAIERTVAAVVYSMDPELPLSDVKTLDERVRAYQAGDRFGAVLFLSFAGVALLLAAFGIYGVMAFTVAQHTHEIGVRVALGATTGSIQRMVIGDGLKLAAIGIAIGLPAAAAVTRLMQGLLFGVTPSDPAAFAVISAALVIVALVACWLPARRAASVDPMKALRAE